MKKLSWSSSKTYFFNFILKKINVYNQIPEGFKGTTAVLGITDLQQYPWNLNLINYVTDDVLCPSWKILKNRFFCHQDMIGLLRSNLGFFSAAKVWFCMGLYWSTRGCNLAAHSSIHALFILRRGLTRFQLIISTLDILFRLDQTKPFRVPLWIRHATSSIKGQF